MSRPRIAITLACVAVLTLLPGSLLSARFPLKTGGILGAASHPTLGAP